MPTGRLVRDVSSVQAWIGAADGREVRLGPGEFTLPTALRSFGPVRIIGAGPGQTILHQDYDGEILNVSGSRGAAYLLATDVPAGAFSVALQSGGATFAAGDYALIRSVAPWPGTDKGAKCGEVVRIEAVAGNTLALYTPTDDAYLTADTATLERLTMVGGVHLEGLTINNTAPGTRTGHGVKFNFVNGLTISDCKFDGIDNPAITLLGCVDFHIDGVRFQDITDDEVNGHYGYGVNATEASRDGRVTNCYMSGGRHLFTTNSYGLGGATSFGVARHITVSTCIATETTNAAYDTHFEGSHITFSNCEAHGVNGFGFQIRAKMTTVRGCTVDRCIGPAVWVRENASGAVVDGVIARNAKTGQVAGRTYSGRGVQVNQAKVKLRGIVSQNTDEDGVYVADACNDQLLSGLSIERPGMGGTNSYGIRFAGVTSGHRGSDIFIDTANVGVIGTAVTDYALLNVQTKNVVIPAQGVTVNRAA